MNTPHTRPALPWWRVPTAWLVMGGPATVVVAGLVTAVIAVRGADPEVGPSAVPRAITTLKIELPTPPAGTAQPAPAQPAAGARP